MREYDSSRLKSGFVISRFRVRFQIQVFQGYDEIAVFLPSLKHSGIQAEN